MKFLLILTSLLLSTSLMAQEPTPVGSERNWAEELAVVDAELSIAVTAELLHHRGVCLVQLGRLPEALVAFRRAGLRRGPDEVIDHNIRMTERRLGIVRPEATSWDDRLRSWLTRVDDRSALVFLLGLEVTALLLLILGARRRILVGSAVLLLAIFLFAASAYRRQYLAVEPTRAVILVDRAQLRAQPGKSQTLLGELEAGHLVVVEEGSDAWIRVRLGERFGYLQSADVGLVN